MIIFHNNILISDENILIKDFITNFWKFLFPFFIQYKNKILTDMIKLEIK
jgi:hypothetical protein